MSDKILQTPCNLEIDYSQVITDPILPFVIELDLTTSILEPAPGQNQRFCYNITGVGQNTSTFADLSHLVFGVCDQIALSQITNVTVVINNVEQTVILGDNVDIMPPSHPDPPTGCPGLKFDFGLNKVTGVMNLCFELTTTYPVGPIPVCLFGGGTPATGLSICGPICSTNQTCQATGYQELSVCVPVAVTPFVTVGTTTTYCCGDPIVTVLSTPCSGNINGSCVFKIFQQLCIAVPVEFGATAAVGSPHVECGEVSSEDICTDCGLD